jgi:hypothetical protein
LNKNGKRLLTGKEIGKRNALGGPREVPATIGEVYKAMPGTGFRVMGATLGFIGLDPGAGPRR